ncbi:MAG: metalloregulator ArsR/SmtB family transcription factor [bacterium]|nr:metalloregulator ArsR/SmtB family transcription factor [bacterium]
MKEKELERIMKALANRRRLAILKYLKEEKEANVGDIAEKIRLSFKATSKHLGILSSSGIVDRDQRSLQMFYRLSGDLPSAARSVLSFL